MYNHYDPNQPRDAEGKWTDAGDAIKKAASDKKLPAIITENTWYRGINKNNKDQEDIFFSADKSVAMDYAINNVGDEPIMVKLLKVDLPANPMVIGSKEDLAAIINFPEDSIFNLNSGFDIKAKKYAQSKGYDAIVYESGSMDEPEMHLFSKK